MTVKELIEILKQTDGNQEVMIVDSTGKIEEDILTIDSDGETTYIVFN